MKRFLLPPLLLLTSLVLSQTGISDFEHGFYTVKNYSPDEYGAHHQNWFVTQDHNGFIYAANGEGILEFDGASWRLISSPGLNAVRTVVVDDDNIKWIGGDRELGYLEPDSLGLLRFKSLKDKIPESTPLTANIWQIFPEGNRIIFAADNALYSWGNDEFTIIPHPGPGLIYREYQVHDKVYVSIPGEGMFQVEGNTLQLIPKGEFFKNLRTTVALPYENEEVIFASKGAGLYIFNGTTVRKLENEVENYLDEHLLYAGQRLPNSNYAFATLRGGVILMDRYGKRVGIISEKEGITNNQIHGLGLDNQKTLWLAHQTGISQVDPISPYSFFDKSSGLEGTVSSIARYKGKLYVGTYSGLFVLNKDAISGTFEFKKINEIKSGCFFLLQTEEELFAATANGVFGISEEEVFQINTLQGCRSLSRLKHDANRIFVGHMHGLSTIKNTDGKWQAEEDISQIKGDIFSITVEDEKTLWLGTSLHQVIKIEFSKLDFNNQNIDFDTLSIKRFSEGLPEGRCNVWLINKELLVTTDGAGGPLFKLDTVAKKFSQEKELGKKFGLDSLLTYPIAYQNEGKHILLESESVEGKQYRFSAFKIGPKKYSVKRFYDESFRSTTDTQLFWDNENYVWSGGEGIAKYDLSSGFDFKTSFNTYVRKVILGQDSIVYGGNPSSHIKTIVTPSIAGIRFEYAAPGREPDANRYQYRLQGFDPNWSDWSGEVKKDYTNLQGGDYQFQARAQNIYGDLSTIGIFNFEILPPWYRTWWAYLLYLFACFSFLWIMLKWRSWQLNAKNIALEKLIAVRTSEVRQQASQLKIQAEKLKELDKSKSRFFANISHEFRTPLSLIKGPIEQLEQNFNEKLSMDAVKMIRRSTNRLLNMVNQLLDLSKIDEGSLKLAPTEGDIYKCLRATTSSFNSYAAQRNIDYKVQIPQSALWTSFDREKLENILYNLLGNAFKFSDDDSEISFTAMYEGYGLQIQVSDLGRGIPTEKLPFIFDRFYQVDNSNTKESEGSGIGLSLSKDLVELMNGTIAVTSELNKGTFFTVKLPIQEIKTGSKKISEEFGLVETTNVQKPYTFSKRDLRELPIILLVEDNADMRHFITEQLMKFYKVTEAINGDIGLKKALINPPNLIITDLMMPKMDGIELCRKLKNNVHTSHIPLIMLTAKAGIENKIEGLETGADDYLTKPFDGKELLVRIKNLIEQRKKLRELYSNSEVQVEPKKVTVTSIDQKFLEKLLDLLETKHSDAQFGVPQMQETLAMSKTQLHRKLKALTNESPGELLRNFRLKRAAQLLAQKADSVTQIAYQVGFNNLSYFAKCFKELYGVAPSSY